MLEAEPAGASATAAAAPGIEPAPRQDDGISRLRKGMHIAAHTAIVRTLYLSARFRGWCIVARGTQVRIGRGARINFVPGARLYVGFGLVSFTATPCAIRLDRDAQLTIGGTVSLLRAVRVYVANRGQLEIGHGCYVNDATTLWCFGRTTLGPWCGISANATILDSNMHEIVIGGVHRRPRAQGVTIGENVWVGYGATIMPGVTLGDQAIIGAASVVTTDIPPRALAAGNPARVIHQDVDWIV
ncbi:MAG TPA: DapH/DapD/GlmU-related protein [Trebonia sp.]|nr:DapH/DapD/GlmU-related protein [Trebonia sp.]